MDVAPLYWFCIDILNWYPIAVSFFFRWHPKPVSDWCIPNQHRNIYWSNYIFVVWNVWQRSNLNEWLWLSAAGGFIVMFSLNELTKMAGIIRCTLLSNRFVPFITLSFSPITRQIGRKLSSVISLHNILWSGLFKVVWIFFILPRKCHSDFVSCHNLRTDCCKSLLDLRFGTFVVSILWSKMFYSVNFYSTVWPFVKKKNSSRVTTP